MPPAERRHRRDKFLPNTSRGTFHRSLILNHAFLHFLQIRHVDEATKDRYAVVYGTDYTSNTTLPPVPAAHTYASWAQSLSDRILQISVKPEQEKHLHCLKPGTFFLFNNLRMKRLQLMMGGVWAAEFGGLFDKLNDRRPRQELQALLQ